MDIQEDQIVAKNYQLREKIGSGAFGEIWKAVNMKTKKAFAVKFEDANTKHQQLYSECRIYLWFHSDSGSIAQAIPSVVYYGIEGGKNVMVMELLGPSLEHMLKLCGHK